MIKKEKFKLVWQSLPPFPMHVSCTNNSNFNFKKEQTILIIAKYNHKWMKEINLLASRRFSKTCLNFKIVLLKIKKKKSINMV